MKRLLWMVGVTASLTSPIGAQPPARTITRATAEGAVRVGPIPPSSPEVRSAEPVIVPTDPNGVRVVAVPVPADLHGRSGQFAFVRRSSLAVVGRLAGMLAPADSGRPIILSVSVPATALAGRLIVGVMRFTCETGCPTVEVPVVLDVRARPDLQLEPSRPLVGTPAGSRVRLEVTVRNTGNELEQVTVTFQMPNDWRSRGLVPMPLQLSAGASALIPVEVLVSDDAGMGDYGVAVRAVSADGAIALAAITVRVGGGQRGAVSWRPMLEANAAVARDATGRVANAYGAELSGEVFPDVRANGRASVVTDAGNLPALTQRAFGRLGYSSNTSFLMLTAPRWEGGVGMLGTSDAGLAGTGLWGVGATARVQSAEWRGGLFDVAPQSGGHYVLGDVSRRLGRVWTGVVASDLQDNLGLGRSSRTIAGNVELPWKDGGLLLQAGRRGNDSSANTGWLARLTHRADNWSFAVRAAHAPGGAAAFAHAEDELQVDGFRRLTKSLSAGAAYWNSRDGGTTGQSDFASNGWSLIQQLSIGSLGTLGLQTHGSRMSGKSGVGTFGNAEREIEASWAGAFAGVQTRLGASRGLLERSSSIGQSIDLEARATRVRFFGAASVASRAGIWQVDVTNERTGAGVGVPTQQMSVAGRVDQVPIVPGRVFARAEVLAYYLGASRSMALSQVLGVDAKLADSYRLTVDVERNDLQRALTGRVPWVVTAKIRRAIGLPAFRRAALRGIVYRDLNGNGVRDRNERGMPGAVIQVDGEMVTADAAGRFDVVRGRPAELEVDPRSLPTGWIAGSRPLEASLSGNMDLAVIPTSPVEVTIRLAGTRGIDTTNVHLDRAVVVLTDSAERRWNGAPDARGVIRFDALPPGVYRVSADLSSVGETLVLPAELPVAFIEGGGAPIRIELRVAPRAIRLSPPAGRSRQVNSGPPADRRQGPDDAR